MALLFTTVSPRAVRRGGLAGKIVAIQQKNRRFFADTAGVVLFFIKMRQSEWLFVRQQQRLWLCVLPIGKIRLPRFFFYEIATPTGVVSQRYIHRQQVANG